MGHVMSVPELRRWLLPFDTRAPGLARARVTACLGPDGPDDAVLVVSELVGNAIRHAHPPLVLGIGIDAAAVRIEVTASHRPDEPIPQRREASDAAGGSGLRIVDACAPDWDWMLDGARLAVRARVPRG